MRACEAINKSLLSSPKVMTGPLIIGPRIDPARCGDFHVLYDGQLNVFAAFPDPQVRDYFESYLNANAFVQEQHGTCDTFGPECGEPKDAGDQRVKPEVGR